VIKIVALAVVLAAGAAYLIFSSTQGSAQYYQTIAEMKAHPQSRDVRVVGVVQNDVARSDAGLHVRFTEADGGQRMPVDYRGTLPDIFKPGVQVVVQGRMGKDGVFHASELQAKCPSRFSSASPAAGASPAG
jgi:cytochrome c-type biogenesis protein CcmE